MHLLHRPHVPPQDCCIACKSLVFRALNRERRSECPFPAGTLRSIGAPPDGIGGPVLKTLPMSRSRYMAAAFLVLASACVFAKQAIRDEAARSGTEAAADF